LCFVHSVYQVSEVELEPESEHPPSTETTEVSVVQKEKNRPPSSEPAHHFNNIADQLLTIFYNIEPYLEVFLFHAIKLFQLGWHHTEWAFQKIGPVVEKELIMELEDGSSAGGWEGVAQETWNKRANMYQKQLKKVAKVTTEVFRKGAKSSRDFTQGLVNDLNKELARKVLKQARA
jgi:hypothetical protein